MISRCELLAERHERDAASATTAQKRETLLAKAALERRNAAIHRDRLNSRFAAQPEGSE